MRVRKGVGITVQSSPITISGRCELDESTQATFDCGPPFRPVSSNGSGNWNKILTSDTFLADISRNNFDIIRLCLAFLVIFSHSYPLLNYELKEPLSVLSVQQTTFGELAVTAFFTISGFLITRSWNGSRSLQSYLVKRVCRIYPGFLVASLLCLFAAKLLLLQPSFPDRLRIWRSIT